jgi:hypothetical protein
MWNAWAVVERDLMVQKREWRIKNDACVWSHRLSREALYCVLLVLGLS